MVVSPPSPDEIRTAVVARWHEPRPGRLSLAGEFADACGTAGEAADGLWDVGDFRASEESWYDELLSAALARVRSEVERVLLDAVVGALTDFASEHPDAPRP